MSNHWTDEIKIMAQSMLLEDVVLTTYQIPHRLMEKLLEFLFANKYSLDNSRVPSFSPFIGSDGKQYVSLYEIHGKQVRLV